MPDDDPVSICPECGYGISDAGTIPCDPGGEPCGRGNIVQCSCSKGGFCRPDFDGCPHGAPAADATTALLIRARGFIERGWCRSAPARDANGNRCAATDEAATSWCAIGALVVAGLPHFTTTKNGEPLLCFPSGNPAVRRLENAVCGNIPDFNDAQETVEPVLAAFDAAIAMGDLAAFDRAIAAGNH